MLHALAVIIFGIARNVVFLNASELAGDATVDGVLNIYVGGGLEDVRAFAAFGRFQILHGARGSNPFVGLMILDEQMCAACAAKVWA